MIGWMLPYLPTWTLWLILPGFYVWNHKDSNRRKGL